MKVRKIVSLDEAYRLKKAEVQVKGHMASGHFVKPHFRRTTTWLVTFADGSKAKVSAKNRWEALQQARQYSGLIPQKVEEQESK